MQIAENARLNGLMLVVCGCVTELGKKTVYFGKRNFKNWKENFIVFISITEEQSFSNLNHLKMNLREFLREIQFSENGSVFF